jgi:hypothetical protein
MVGGLNNLISYGRPLTPCNSHLTIRRYIDPNFTAHTRTPLRFLGDTQVPARIHGLTVLIERDARIPPKKNPPPLRFFSCFVAIGMFPLCDSSSSSSVLLDDFNRGIGFFSCGDPCFAFFLALFVILPIKSIHKIKAVLADSTVFPTESQFAD